MKLIPDLQAPSLDATLHQLLKQWRDETALYSSSTQVISHPAYQRIIALGPAIVPLLLREMEKTGDGHLSHALTAITGARPVTKEEEGRIPKIVEAWLRWGRENDLSW